MKTGRKDFKKLKTARLCFEKQRKEEDLWKQSIEDSKSLTTLADQMVTKLTRSSSDRK
jgi:hypothetical protein